MNVPMKHYDGALHEVYRAFVVSERAAAELGRIAFIDDEGVAHAKKDAVIRGSNTEYRGEVLVCAGGACVLLADLVDVIPVGQLRPDQLERTCTGFSPDGARFAWKLGNPRPVIPMPCRTVKATGLFRLAFDRGDITEYPRRVKIGEETLLTLQRVARVTAQNCVFRALRQQDI